MDVTHSLLALADPEVWFQFSGRLHPLAVHFPIALVPLALGAELWHILRRREGVSSAARVLLWLAVLAAAVAIWCGWQNAAFEWSNMDQGWLGDRDAEGPAAADRRALFLHRWASVALGGMLLVTALASVIAVRPTAGGARVLTRLGLFASCLVLAFSGHIGGELVHGHGYVFEPLRAATERTETSEESADDGTPAPVEPAGDATTDDPAVGAADDAADDAGNDARDRAEAAGASEGAADADSTGEADEADGAGGDAPASESEGVVTDDASDASEPVAIEVDLAALESRALAILDQSCRECHGARRPKAGLQIVPLVHLFEWETEWWTVVPGKPDASLLLERMELPDDDPAVMPPDGRLPDADLQAIRAWIAAGAPVDGKRVEMETPPAAGSVEGPAPSP